MDTRSHDLLTQRLGFGCGRLNGGGDKATSVRLVHTALDLGIRHFDTAPPYGLGASESVLGEALKGRQEAVTVATKAGLARPASAGLKQKARAVVKPLARWIPGLRQAVLKGMARRAPAANFDFDFIARSFETSLQQLQRGRVDFLLMHEAQPHDPLGPLQSLLERYVATGQLGAYGSSTGEPASQLVRFGSVLQYRCPAPGADWTTVDPADVLHGALRFIAPAIGPAMARDRQLRDQRRHRRAGAGLRPGPLRQPPAHLDPPAAAPDHHRRATAVHHGLGRLARRHVPASRRLQAGARLMSAVGPFPRRSAAQCAARRVVR
jgi:hypothetical protein